MHLRRDGVSCFTFTYDKEIIWTQPCVFLFQFEAWLLGEKLLEHQCDHSGDSLAITYLYWQLILRLMVHALKRDEFSPLNYPFTYTTENQHLGLHPANSSRVFKWTGYFR